MKARDARRIFIVEVALAFVAVFTCSAVIGAAAVAPFIYAKVGEILAKAKENHREGMPAAKAAKAKRDALKKEQAQLEKDKKALDKKKLATRKAQAKKIYEERVKNGYEASLDIVNREAKGSLEAEMTGAAAPKKAKKQKAPKEKVKKEKKSGTEIAAPESFPTPAAIAEAEAMNLEASAPAQDYTSNGSMFRGISF